MPDDAKETLDAAQNAGLRLDERSLRIAGRAALWFDSNARTLHAAGPADDPILRELDGPTSELVAGYVHLTGPRSHANAAALRVSMPNLRPRPLGLATSAGFGDRLGIATPGHVRALERVLQAHDAADIAPIFAQQSIREMARTGRTPQDVMDDATWGAFEAGWAGPVGADADHLKTPEHVDRCVAAGFTFSTVDPGDHIVDEARRASTTGATARSSSARWTATRRSRALGPFKISLHSGSDKFLVYGPIAEATRGLVHLKTAGTSYLEALRVAAVHAPGLFRDILALAKERFSEDRATYHVSARLDAVPEPEQMRDSDLAGLLDQDDARQVLHVTFGSALDEFREPLTDLLLAETEAHYERLARHFAKHLEPFAPHARPDPGGQR